MTDSKIAAGGDNLSLIGTTIAGKYEILSLVGEGGMGAVYKASHLLMKGIVAVKMLHPNMAEPAKLKRFQQEAQATFRLSHSNIIRVHDFGVSESGRPYMVMDFLQGKSLADVISEQGRVPVDRVLDIAIQASDALSHAHSQGIVHRDLKPSNIMLVQTDSDWDSVRIVDFGIARIIPLQGEELHRLTQTGEVFGSPYYMSPEQCMGNQPDLRSDIYSFGCLLYEALIGQPPFKCNHLFETFSKHLNEMPPALAIAGCDRSLLDRLDAVIFKSMEKNPDKRYQSMSELKNDLESVRKELSGGVGFMRALSGGPMQLLRHVRRQIAAHPRVALAMLVLLITAPAAAGIPSAYALLMRRGPTEKQMMWQRPHTPIEKKPVDYSTCERKSRHYVGMLRRANDPDGHELMRNLNKLAVFYSKYGEWQRAAQTYLELLDVYKVRSGIKCQPYADVSESLADCYYEQGLLSEARGYYQQTIDIRRLGALTPQLARPCSRLADVYYSQGNWPGAAENYTVALKIWSECGQFPPYLDDNGKFVVLRQITDSKAGDRQMQVLQNPQNFDVAWSVSKLGDIDRIQERPLRAEVAYRDGLVFWPKATEGPDRINEALCLDRLGLVLMKNNNYEEADRRFFTAQRKLEKILGSDHPFVATVLQNHADLMWAQNRWWDALVMRVKAADILQKANTD